MLRCLLCHATFRGGDDRCPRDGTALVESDRDPLIGQVVGGSYQLVELLGSGGMGQVYRAKHVRVRRPFAVKVVFGDLGVEAKVMERFHREVEALSRVQHQNVVGIIDFGTTERGLSYLVMDLVEGATLDRVLEREGSFSPERGMAIARQLADGLSAIHAQGIVHRDLKPQNVMLVKGAAETELVRILDFGIVLIDALPDASAPARLTTTGFFFGSPAYAAPEQIGRMDEDWRADLYALGVLLFEMLAGEPPFTGSVTEVLAKRAQFVAPVLRVKPRALVALVSRLLSQRPSQRPPSAAAVVEELDSIRAATDEEGPPKTERQRPFFRAGDRVASRFTIERPLGRGGMGVVFEAYDDERGERVALKTLSDLEPEGIYRLKREFRALADLVHPNLVRLYELFCDQGLWFFTMARVDGIGFFERVRPSGVLDEPMLRRALAQLVKGVGAIHRAGKLHCDLKPSNVLVDEAGHLRILDFGLVRSETKKVDTTRDLAGGTPAYAAPEQFGVEGASAASDAYAIGVMLYESLTGALPFSGSARDIFLAKMEGKIPPLAGGVPSDLAELATSLLRSAPETRLSIEELVVRTVGAHDASGALAPATPLSGPRRTVFVGRERELARMMDAFARVTRGEPRILYVAGLSGIGKTALVDRLLDELRADERASPVILKGRCYERESVPFKALDAVSDALARHVGGVDRVEAARLMPRDAADLCRSSPRWVGSPRWRKRCWPGRPAAIRRRSGAAPFSHCERSSRGSRTGGRSWWRSTIYNGATSTAQLS